MAQTIFILEDDENIRELVTYALTSVGFIPKGFETPSSFFAALEEEKPDLLLLDIMLPEQDGIAVLKTIKSSPFTQMIPTIMLTAKGSEYDRVIGLDLGADDYITKPFSVLELISRIKAVQRRSLPITEDNVLRCGHLTINIEKHEVRIEDKEVVLTFKEFQLLKCLMQNEELVLSRDQLIDKVWGLDFLGETRTVDMRIKTLRQKLGDMGRHIATVRGVGYKWKKELL